MAELHKNAPAWQTRRDEAMSQEAAYARGKEDRKEEDGKAETDAGNQPFSGGIAHIGSGR